MRKPETLPHEMRARKWSRRNATSRCGGRGTAGRSEDGPASPRRTKRPPAAGPRAPPRPPLRGAETHVRTEPARGAGHRRGPARSRRALRPARSPRSTRQRHCPGLGGRELRSRAHTWRKRLSDESQQGGAACRVIPPE